MFLLALVEWLPQILRAGDKLGRLQHRIDVLVSFSLICSNRWLYVTRVSEEHFFHVIKKAGSGATVYILPSAALRVCKKRPIDR